ncbi:cupin domain-containing protein [Planomicrobium sp. YIM 101495]|uniref:cupin domain-containing protein n=1 Tax=Planomicrobium sp. YIM 101495 TaxID=2665160 RepID=UPI0012B87805|nr:cupin domain-containing protein [Planomicrobium sp. YIM 101495]MTD31069.1 cupin domain-containing protein [Planomicrobium sp. YIM 101495]
MKLIETPLLLGEKKRHFGKVLKFEKTLVTTVQLQKGEGMEEHSSKKDVMIVVRQGIVSFEHDGERVNAAPDNVLYIEPEQLHSVHAEEDSEFLLIQTGR